MRTFPHHLVRCRSQVVLAAVLLPVFLLSALCARARSDSSAAAKSAIQAAYNRMDSAATRKDVVGTTAYNAPGFAKDKRAAEKQASTTRFIFSVAQSIRGTSTVQSITVKGNQAVVTVRRLQSFVVSVPDPQTGRHDSYLYDSLLRETWRKGQADWRRMASQRISMRVRKNGVPMGQKKS